MQFNRAAFHFDEVTNVVLANNPAIKAAQEKWQAIKARVPQAAAWEDLRAQARSRVARYVSIPPNAFTVKASCSSRKFQFWEKI